MGGTYRDGIGLLRDLDTLALIPTDDVAPGATTAAPIDLDIHPVFTKGHTAMFGPETPMMLRSVTFGTEVVDQETRRVVSCTFGISPFTAVHADQLNVKTLLFDSKGLPKAGLLESKVKIEAPPQRVTFAPVEGVDGRVIINDVVLDSVLKVKCKMDREPATFDALFSLTFRYPSQEDLFYLANGVNNQHSLTFEVAQPPLDFKAAPESDVEDTRYPRRHQKTAPAGASA